MLAKCYGVANSVVGIAFFSVSKVCLVFCRTRLKFDELHGLCSLLSVLPRRRRSDCIAVIDEARLLPFELSEHTAISARIYGFYSGSKGYGELITADGAREIRDICDVLNSPFRRKEDFRTPFRIVLPVRHIRVRMSSTFCSVS